MRGGNVGSGCGICIASESVATETYAFFTQRFIAQSAPATECNSLILPKILCPQSPNWRMGTDNLPRRLIPTMGAFRRDVCAACWRQQRRWTVNNRAIYTVLAVVVVLILAVWLLSPRPST